MNTKKIEEKFVQLFFKNNPNVNLKTFRFFSQQAVSSLKLSEGEDRYSELEILQSLQRLLRMLPFEGEDRNLQIAESFYQAGIHSALQIASMAKKKFMEEYADYFPDDLKQSRAEQALAVYENALAIKTKLVMTYAAISQHTAAYYANSRFNNLMGTTTSNFNDLPSYEDSFGGLDFCTCEHCRSIFSPAAYFVDLMRLQDKYISIGSGGYSLEKRRRDLWDVELSCDNTNTLVPSIQIVNEVLYGNSGLPKPNKGDSQDKIYKPFDSEVYPFNLPFTLPLEKIHQILLLKELTLQKVWIALTPKDKFAEARENIDIISLGSSLSQWYICYVTETNQGKLATYYGFPNTTNNLVELLTPVDTFLLQTGLTHNEMYQLLFEDIDTDGMTKEELRAELKLFFINIDSSDPLLLEDGIDNLKNLDLNKLDRINRFVRLAHIMDWSFIDLDWALRTSGPFNNGRIFFDSGLPILSFIKNLQNYQPELSVSQVCSYIGVMKDIKSQKTGLSFFDTVYNAENVPNPPEWQNPDTGEYDLTWDLPSLSTVLNTIDKEDQQIQSAMAAALQLNQSDLIAVGNQVLAYQIEQDETNGNTINLTLSALSIFYRFSQLPLLTGLSLNECLVALSLPGAPEKSLLDNAQAGTVISWLIEYAKWINDTAITTYQLQYLVTGQSENATVQNQILGNESIKNFYDNFVKTMEENLITETKFGDALGGILLEPEYSPKAAAVVYKALGDQSYIKDGIVDSVPELSEMEEIVVTVFPENTKKDNANVVSLSKRIIVILNQYEGKTLLEENFIIVSQSDFTTYMVADNLLENIWKKLENASYIESDNDDPQLVLQLSLTDEIQKVIKVVLFPYITDSLLDNISQLVTSTLNNYYQLQQSTLNKNLESLYNVPTQVCSAIEVWGALSLGEIEQATTNFAEGNNSDATIPLIQAILNAKSSGLESWRSFTNQIRLLQVYSVLAKLLSLSASEVKNIVNNPEFYGVEYKPGTQEIPVLQFTLINIRTLDAFKKIIQTCRDTQNRLLDYMRYVSRKPEEKAEAAKLLSEITNWDEEEIEFLITNLWKDSKDPIWGYVYGLQRLYQWFSLNAESNLDISVLWQVYLLVFAKNFSPEKLSDFYDSCSEVATPAWSGLVANQINNDKVEILKTNIEIQIRDATLDFVINQLRTVDNVPITNARDLYNYLLIDVEVGPPVETSYISSAISSVQLFIQRCRNSLEPGATIETELNQWWDWIGNYRVWEANRRVFLYPENYIQPELRKQKTPLFEKLESELKQGDLRNPVTIETAFQNYLDGFSEVANLEIVSSAGYDIVKEGKKIICLIGRTVNAPYHYYYRIVTLVKDIKNKFLKNPRYIPVKWYPWYKIDIGIEAIGPIQTVFAFGKWFIYWVQQSQVGQDSNSKVNIYKATCYCSYLNFNQNWVSPQVVNEPVTMPGSIEMMVENSYLNDLSYWNQVDLSYFNTTDTIIVTYGKDQDYKFGSYTSKCNQHIFMNQIGTLSSGMVDMFRYASNQATLTSFDLYQTNSLSYWYWEVFNTKLSQTKYNNLWVGNFSFSTWIYIYEYPKDNADIVNFYDASNKVLFGLNITKSGVINATINSSSTKTSFTLKKDRWYQLTTTECGGGKDITVSNSGKSLFSNLFTYQGNLYLIWIASNKELRLSKVDTVNSSAKSYSTLAKNVYSDGKACLIEFEDDLYVSWMIESNNSISTQIAKVDSQSLKIVGNTNTVQISTDSVPGFSQWNDQLYLTWKDTQNNNDLTVGIINTADGKVSNKTIVTKTNGQKIVCTQSPTMITYQNSLLLCWIQKGSTPIDDMYASVYNPTSNTTNPNFLNNQAYQTPNLYDQGGKIFIAWHGGVKDYANFAFLKIEKVDSSFNVAIDSSQKIIARNISVICTPGLAAIDDQIFTSVSPKDDTSILIYSWLITFLFVDKQLSTKIYSHNISNTAFNYLYLGSDKDGNLINASMQEILVYRRPLSLNEISLLYKNSVDRITQDYEVIKDASSEKFFGTDIIDSAIPVVNQPANLCLRDLGISLLASFYYYSDEGHTKCYLDCFRLNTAAFNQLSQTLLMKGIGNMLDVPSQETPEVSFEALRPNPNLIPKLVWPSDSIDFNFGAMTEYYWEIFFFAPFLIAYSLEKDQRFERATAWYQYIFNPTISQENFDLEEKDQDENDKYWRFLGLRSYNNPVLGYELSLTWAEEVEKDLQSAAQLYEYHNDPFDPQAIARLRPIAYQKTLVMHYIKNTLNWADNLFRQYTVESIVEANMLYVTAYDLLGQQPTNLGPCPLPPEMDLQELQDDLGKVSLEDIPEFLIQLENKFQYATTTSTKDTPNNYIPGLYFGLPENSQFIAYWDLVHNRLYNIRNGLNIDGVRQQLSLFEPAINPALLAKQIASGQSVSAALNSLQVSIPYYRFDVMIQKAKMLAQVVTQFGQSLLSTLEKKNAESLSLLQSQHQQNILALTTGTKQAQLDAAEKSLEALQYSLQNAQDRHKHYNALLAKGWSAGEEAQVALNASAITLMTLAQPLKSLAVVSYLMPNTFGLANGGMQFGHAAQQATNILEGTANTLNTSAGLAATVAGYQRREEDWKLQKKLAQDDIDQINSQILSAQYQVQSAQDEVIILQKNIDQEQEIERFLKNKFTNQQLYLWISGQLSSLYFQAYQLAYNLALQAEKSWQFEQGTPDSFIQPNYWNSLYEGLVAGESLQLDLERMEAAYMKQNDRRLEIQKTISLFILDRDALNNLINNGECIFDISEKDFDCDYPGHYCRQIKTVSITIPAVVGPYQNLHATLTQTANKTLLKADHDGVGYLLGEKGSSIPHHSILKVDVKANQQIALSQGMNDVGLFTMNFNDERYLPFEGTGAVSTWKLSVPKETNTYNDRYILEDLPDVIIQIQYTAIAGNHNFTTAVNKLCKKTK